MFYHVEGELVALVGELVFGHEQKVLYGVGEVDAACHEALRVGGCGVDYFLPLAEVLEEGRFGHLVNVEVMVFVGGEIADEAVLLFFVVKGDAALGGYEGLAGVDFPGFGALGLFGGSSFGGVLLFALAEVFAAAQAGVDALELGEVDVPHYFGLKTCCTHGGFGGGFGFGLRLVFGLGFGSIGFVGFGRGFVDNGDVGGH